MPTPLPLLLFRLSTTIPQFADCFISSPEPEVLPPPREATSTLIPPILLRIDHEFSRRSSRVSSTSSLGSVLISVCVRDNAVRSLSPINIKLQIMDFQPGEFLNVKEVHYNQHGLLLLEGQGIYRLVIFNAFSSTFSLPPSSTMLLRLAYCFPPLRPFLSRLVSFAAPATSTVWGRPRTRSTFFPCSFPRSSPAIHPIPRPVIPVTAPPLLVPPAPAPAPSKPPVIRVYTRLPPNSVAPLQSASTTTTPHPADQVSPSTAHPLENCVSLHRLSPQLHTFSTSLFSVSVPNSVQEALQYPGWWAAMEEEMAALWANQTWTLVSLPPCQKPVGCKWVFVIKHAADGTIDRLKARLVARGFTQQQGLEYEETFSPVDKLNTVRVLISVAVHRQWPLLQLDIKNAFLNGDLQETVYMQQPPEFETTGESQVCHLLKALYGLKQSPRAWFDKFSKALRDIGFTRRSADFSLSTRHRTTGTVLLLVYVDNIIIRGDDSQGMQAVKLHLSSVFQTKDLGPLRHFLGLEVARRPDGLVLFQRKYCLDLLHDAGYSDCRPSDTPMDVNHELCAQASDSDLLLQNPEYYRVASLEN
ncbi:hypothetical protein KSP39_PZI001100 [Platanthera zijinensis]|uniref:Reverse transcriptase Ty1/copia-type domain-containing protein n=1 Tax=Platanthera zijinensis TaxID=2320716 RepID=A0AAP0C1P9_9ASPA